MKSMAAVVGIAFVFTGPPAASEEVVPTLSSYTFSKQPGAQTDECGITLLVTSYPSPEYASARLQAIRGTGGVYAGKSTWGLIITVRDATYVNGRVTKFTPVPLSHAAFTGFEFSSDGRLVSAPETDGSIFLYGPNDSVVGALASAFQLGKATVSFTRVGSAAVRSYTLTQGPPPPVMQQFIACTQKMYGIALEQR